MRGKNCEKQRGKKSVNATEKLKIVKTRGEKERNFSGLLREKNRL